MILKTSDILDAAKTAAREITGLSTARKNAALMEMARHLSLSAGDILAANRKDMELAKGKISEVMLDRLSLTEQRIEAMADGIRALIALPDPVGRELKRTERPDGLLLRKVSVPFGVVGIIYESRPNVTSDAASLAIKSGNACVLRGGKEAFQSANAIVAALKNGLREAGVCENAVNLIQDTDRRSAIEMMTATEKIDLLIPRGSAGLIRACRDNATVPCILTGTGICHIYIEKSADQEMALDIIENAKASRPSVCNAAEVCLVDRAIAAEFLPKLSHRLSEQRRRAGKIPVELRLSPEALSIVSGTPMTESDFDTEFLDYILAIGIVENTEEAITHIAAHSTAHSDAIITRSDDAASRFCEMVDSTAVYVNASTRFTDGGEFGLGCEMGISTQKLHARGPMGLEELTTYKYIIRGQGNIR